MRIYDLTTNDGHNTVSGELRELSRAEMVAVSGGVGTFLRGDLVSGRTATTNLSGNGQTASFPLSISNARFTQSGTTLCNWEKCTVYISGC